MFYPGYYYLQSSALHGLVWSGARGPQAPQTQSKHSHQLGTQPSTFTYTIIHLQSRSCNTGNQHTLPNHTLTDARTKNNTKRIDFSVLIVSTRTDKSSHRFCFAATCFLKTVFLKT